MKTAFVSGNFNVLHPGHMRLLRFARDVSDHLIVGVWSDRCAGKDAHVPENLRLEGVRSNGWVDEAFLLDEPVETVIDRLRPDIVVKGKEHEKKDNPETTVLKHYGARLVFSSGGATFSSLDLIRKNINYADYSSILFPKIFADRHGFSTTNLLAILSRIKGKKICVIGDLIVDEYVTCVPLGMSQEDPSIVVTPIDRKRFLGGAGIVAAHAASLGADVNFISVIGDDDSGEFARGELMEVGVNAVLHKDSARPTSLKQRFRAEEKTLLRVNHLYQGSIDQQLQKVLLGEVSQAMVDSEILVFADFNYGCLPQSLVDQIVAIGKETGIFMAADSQSSSQIGNVARFQGMHLLTPTEREARISLRNHEDGLVVVAEELCELAQARHVFLKLGSEGMLLHVARRDEKYRTDRIPALNPNPRDVAGAGDSLLVGSILALATGATPWEAACLGGLSAAIQVSRVGNTPLTLDELRYELEK